MTVRILTVGDVMPHTLTDVKNIETYADGRVLRVDFHDGSTRGYAVRNIVWWGVGA